MRQRLSASPTAMRSHREVACSASVSSSWRRYAFIFPFQPPWHPRIRIQSGCETNKGVQIEHYVDPESDKKHKYKLTAPHHILKRDMELIKSNSRFNEIKDVEIEFLTRVIQLSGKTTTIRMPVGTAVRDGIVDNETLGYFLARIQLFRTFLLHAQSSLF